MGNGVFLFCGKIIQELGEYQSMPKIIGHRNRYPYVQNVCDQRFKQRRVCRTFIKNEDTWCGVLGYYTYRIRFNPESIRRVVTWETLRTILMAIRTSSRRIAMMTVVGSTRTTTIPTTSGIVRTASPSSSRNSLHFSPAFLLGEFCFASCPCHPPSIFPISESGSERAIYRFCSSESVSKRMSRKNLIASHFRMATFTYGNFSSGFKNVAVKTISIVSTNKSSTRLPRE